MAGASVSLVAKEAYHNTLLFGPAEADAGSATTDTAGTFAVIPYSYSFTATFEINARKDSRAAGVVLEKAAILASGANDVYADTLFLRN